MHMLYCTVLSLVVDADADCFWCRKDWTLVSVVMLDVYMFPRARLWISITWWVCGQQYLSRSFHLILGRDPDPNPKVSTFIDVRLQHYCAEGLKALQLGNRKFDEGLKAAIMKSKIR